jgi:hypothetical protein
MNLVLQPWKQDPARPRGWMPKACKVHILVLQQLVLLPELAHFWADPSFSAWEGADLTAELLFHLPAGLQVSLQLFNVLFQPTRRRKAAFSPGRGHPQGLWWGTLYEGCWTVRWIAEGPTAPLSAICLVLLFTILPARDNYFFFFGSTWTWTQDLHPEPLYQPYFCEGFFKTGSCKLFAQTGFKQWSSWSLSPEYLGL